ncbi:MAG TPA: hypothetical protein ENO11_04700 [Desulfobacteraceae bacterium]|nr:hypothetical protein [Desulfobacteraceae bacterium]
MEQITAIKNGPAVHCNVFDYCAGKDSDEIRCWEIARSACDFHYVFNVCTDCIVYLYEKDITPRKEIEQILESRKHAPIG